VEPYKGTLFLLLAGIFATSISSYFLASSQRTFPIFKRKSFWKLMEIPWLALACAAILLAQQTLFLRDLDNSARLWHGAFSLFAYQLQDYLGKASAELPPELINKYGMQGCKTDDGDALMKVTNIDAHSEEPISDTCVWLALVGWSMHSINQIFASMEIGGGEEISGSVQFVFRSPLSTKEALNAQTEAIFDALKNPEYRENIDLEKLCTIDVNEPGAAKRSNKEIEYIKQAFELGCAAMIAGAGHTLSRVRASDVTLFKSVASFWPIILIIGLCFRLSRTVAEYHLDRVTEREKLDSSRISRAIDTPPPRDTTREGRPAEVQYP